MSTIFFIFSSIGLLQKSWQVKETKIRNRGPVFNVNIEQNKRRMGDSTLTTLQGIFSILTFLQYRGS